MYSRSQLIDNKWDRCLNKTEQWRKQLVVGNERGNRGSGADAKKLPASSTLIKCQEIGRRLILLEIRLIIQPSPTDFQWFSQGCVELRCKFKRIGEVRS
jgi:hypothetical protein